MSRKTPEHLMSVEALGWDPERREYTSEEKRRKREHAKGGRKEERERGKEKGSMKERVGRA